MSPTIVPILPTPDPDATASFFSKLGFAETARFPNEYIILEHPIGLELHFFLQQGLEPESNDHGCYVRFDTAAEAAALYDEWAKVELGGGTLHPPTETDYALLEFALLDQHRNLLRIGGAIQQ